MSIATLNSLPTPAQPIPQAPALRRFTVDEYHRMIDSGIIQEDHPVELIEGLVVYKMGRNPPHDAVIDTLQELLLDRIDRKKWRVRVQSAITTADSEPEPDLVIALGPASRYRDRHPQPEDISLVIEVASSSLAADRTAKSQVFARAGIPNYCIVNLIDRVFELYTAPDTQATPPAYRHVAIVRPGETLKIELRDGALVQIPVVDVLGS